MEFLPFAVQSVMVSFAPLFSKCVFDRDYSEDTGLLPTGV